jgi:glutathione S-transferase
MLLYDAPNPAPNPRRVRIYLAEKGLIVPTQQISIFKGEHKSSDYLAHYPYGQVPALQLGSVDGAEAQVIGESVSICRYFEALHPDPPLFGTDALSIAQIDMWLRRIDLTLGTAIRNIWVHTHPLTARIVKPQYTEFGESNRPLAVDAMRRFNSALEETPYLAGEVFSMADISLLATIDFGIFIGMTLPEELSALNDWHRRISARASASA